MLKYEKPLEALEALEPITSNIGDLVMRLKIKPNIIKAISVKFDNSTIFVTANWTEQKPKSASCPPV